MNMLIKSLRLTIAFSLFFALFYVSVLWLFARIAAPANGEAEMLTDRNKEIGALYVGQSFTDSIYFWGRPSHAGTGYDATASAGSNKGPTNEEYLQEVEMRIVSFLKKHPYLKRSEIPAEMVTASASGLDPHISPQCARIQVKRVAKARGMDERLVSQIVQDHIESPFLGFFGTEKVNVLKLNIALNNPK